MSTIQALLSKAQQYQQQGDFKQAIAVLGEAGQAGHMYAALDHAYYKVSEDPATAIRYLLHIPDSQSLTIRYHTALIRRFYLDQNFTDDSIEEITTLAQEGHAESLLVLLSWSVDNADAYQQVAAHLAYTRPNIFKQLTRPSDASVVPQHTALDHALMVQAIREREQALDSLNSETLDEGIGLLKVDGALSAFECNYFTQRFTPLLSPSMVASPVDGEPMQDNVRTSDVASITFEMADWIVRDIDLRLAALSDSDVQCGEPLNLLRYQGGQQYRGHYDAFTDNRVNSDKMQAEGGQRTKTALAYLNTVAGEGETVFPKLDLAIKPETGVVIVFSNVDSEQRLRKDSYHSGRPVEKQKKWTLTKWIRKYPTQYGKFTHGV